MVLIKTRGGGSRFITPGPPSFMREAFALHGLAAGVRTSIHPTRLGTWTSLDGIPDKIGRARRAEAGGSSAYRGKWGGKRDGRSRESRKCFSPRPRRGKITTPGGIGILRGGGGGLNCESFRRPMDRNRAPRDSRQARQRWRIDRTRNKQGRGIDGVGDGVNGRYPLFLCLSGFFFSLSRVWAPRSASEKKETHPDRVWWPWENSYPLALVQVVSGRTGDGRDRCRSVGFSSGSVVVPFSLQTHVEDSVLFTAVVAILYGTNNSSILRSCLQLPDRARANISARRLAGVEDRRFDESASNRVTLSAYLPFLTSTACYLLVKYRPHPSYLHEPSGAVN